MYLLGCSFTGNIPGTAPDLHNRLINDYGVINLGVASYSNFQIRNTLFDLPDNCNAIIQWTALSRPDGIKHNDIDWNKNLNKALFDKYDPLLYLIEIFIKVVSEAVTILKVKNINAYHYMGWQQWTDKDLTNDLRDKLKDLPINWFPVPETIDIVSQSCWEYNYELFNSIYEENKTSRMMWKWYSNIWGGMSEWIRYNIKDPDKRYVGYNGDIFDSHPSNFATTEFYNNIIIPEILKLKG